MSVYDRWHKSKPGPGDVPCKEHSRGSTKLYPTSEHMRGDRWLVRWRSESGEQLKRSFPRRSGRNPEACAEAFDAQRHADEARGEWIDQRMNCCLIGGSGTGKTHVATAWGLALCRLGKRVKFVTAAGLVLQLEEAQQQHRLDRLLRTLDRLDLLIVDELGYLSFSRSGAELLFQVFADRYERRSLLITSNLAFGDWGQVFQGERMTAALLDRLTHRCHIFEMNGESYRFRESMKAKKDKDPKKDK